MAPLTYFITAMIVFGQHDFSTDEIFNLCLLQMPSIPGSVILYNTYSILFLFGPIVCVLVAVVLLIIIAGWKARHSPASEAPQLRLSGVFPVVLIAGMFLLSNVGVFLINVVPKLVLFSWINVIGNIFIYTASIRSFRVFLFTWMCGYCKRTVSQSQVVRSQVTLSSL